jgi:hypothetical protein
LKSEKVIGYKLFEAAKLIKAAFGFKQILREEKEEKKG